MTDVSEILQVSGARRSISEFVRIFSKSQSRQMIMVALSSLAIGLLDVAGLALLFPLVSGLTGSSSGMSLPIVDVVSTQMLLWSVVCLFALKTLANAALRWWMSGVVLRTEAIASTELFKLYMLAPLSYHDSHNSGLILNRLQLTLNRVVSRGWFGTITARSEGLILVTLAIGIVMVAPTVGSVGILYFVATAWCFTRVINPRLRRVVAPLELSSSRAFQAVQEGLGGLREHRVRKTEAVFIERFEKNRLLGSRASQIINFLPEVSRYYLELSFVLGIAVISAVAWFIGNHESLLPTLAVLVGAGFRVLPSLSRLTAALANIRHGRAALDLVLSDVDELNAAGLSEVPQRTTVTQLNLDSADRAASVTVKNCDYSHPTGERALSDISFRLDPGQCLAITGRSGSGKSTLVDILCGVRQPSKGEVRVETTGGDCRVGLVSQSVFLVDDSIASNVAFGLPIQSNLIEDALRRASLWDFVCSLPSGVETLVGERGARLSGGQRQRLGLARALYGQPNLLILDEPTSSLDHQTELTLIDTVLNLTSRLTLIIVSHRASTLRRCPHVLYLENGLVKASGSFELVSSIAGTLEE